MNISNHLEIGMFQAPAHLLGSKPMKEDHVGTRAHLGKWFRLVQRISPQKMGEASAANVLASQAHEPEFHLQYPQESKHGSGCQWFSAVEAGTGGYEGSSASLE